MRLKAHRHTKVYNYKSLFSMPYQYYINFLQSTFLKGRGSNELRCSSLPPSAPRPVRVCRKAENTFHGLHHKKSPGSTAGALLIIIHAVYVFFRILSGHAARKSGFEEIDPGQKNAIRCFFTYSTYPSGLLDCHLHASVHIS